MFKNIKREFEKAGKQLSAIARQTTDEDAVRGDNMKIVNDRDGKALQEFLFKQCDLKLLTKEVAGYQGDSFLSFLFGKAIIEADLVTKGAKALTNHEVIGSLYLLLYTAHHCSAHGEGGRIPFFLNKAINDKAASQDTRNLLDKALQTSKYDPITDSFAFSISGFSINDAGILVPSASKDLECKLDQSTCSLDGAEEDKESLDAHEKQQLELATLESLNPVVERQEAAADMQARIALLEDQMRILQQQNAPPPPYAQHEEELSSQLAGADTD